MYAARTNQIDQILWWRCELSLIWECSVGGFGDGVGVPSTFPVALSGRGILVMENEGNVAFGLHILGNNQFKIDQNHGYSLGGMPLRGR